MPDKSTSFLHLESQAHGGAFGHNLIPTPTDAQCKAGNYKLGRITLHGLSIAIEQPRGTYRTGIGADGKRWTSRMAAHYGYFSGTRGNDGDGVDCFVGFYHQSEMAYVINQNVDSRFDEHKCLIGFPDEESARRAYTDSYDRGWPGLASIVPASISQLKWWLKNGDMTRPLKPEHLPHEGREPMNRRMQWSADALPYDQTLDQVLYDIRRMDAGEDLMLDSVTMADILADSDGVLAFDALVVPFASLERRMGVMQRVMKRNAQTVKPVARQITEPFTQRGVANVAALFELSDGQTVSIYFHNPDVTPKKMAGTDELISWKWLLNKKDLTIVVAPERGVDLDINEVARRIMKLAEKNSAAFTRANSKRAETMQRLTNLGDEIAVLETELSLAQRALEVAQIETEDRVAAVSRQVMALIAEQDRVLKLLEAEKAFGQGADTVKLEALMNQYDDLVDKIRTLRGEVAEGRSSWAVWKALRDADNARNSPSLLIKTAIANALSHTDGKVETSDALVWALSKSSLNKMVASNNKDGEKPFQKERILAIQSIQSIAKAAISPLVRPDDNNSPEIEAIFEYFSTFETGGKTYKVRLLCKKFVKDSSADDKMHSLKLDGVPDYQGIPDGLLISLEIIGDVAELGNPDLSLPPSAEGGSTLAQQSEEVNTPADAILHSFPGENNMQSEVRSRPDGKFGAILRDLDSGEVAGIFIVDTQEGAIAKAKELVNSYELTPEGRESKVKTAKGTEVVTGFAVVEADRLITSHDPATGDVNPEFPQDLQPRDRARETSRAWVLKTAANLDPEQLGKTRRADTGAPIVGPDRVVESGNGRTMAIVEAYRIGKADEYRAWLESEADYFGLSAEKVKSMKRPVLVRIRTSNVNRAEFAVEANQDDKLAMTATEKARADANRLTDDMIALMTDNGDLNAAANTAFLSSFLRSLGDAEAAQYSTSEGKPTSSLIARVQAAIFAKAYNDDRLLELTADSAKPEIANIISALNFAAPEFIQSAALDPVAAGGATQKLADSIEASLNTQAVAAIIGATNVIKQAKESGMQVDEFIKQQGLFGDLDPSVAAMAVFIAKNNRSAKRMGAAFKAMATFVKGEIERRQTTDMFGEPVPIGFPEIIAAANRELDRMFGEGAFAIETVDLFAPPAAPAPIDTPDQAAKYTVGQRVTFKLYPYASGEKADQKAEGEITKVQSFEEVTTSGLTGQKSKKLVSSYTIRLDSGLVREQIDEDDVFGEVAMIEEEKFAKSPDGAIDFGGVPDLQSQLDPSKTYPSAPIRMEEGGAFGRAHIQPQRLEEFKANGYESEAEMLDDVAKHFTHIYEQPNGRLMLVKRNGRAKFGVVELQLNGGYYGVTTLFLEDQSPKGKPYEERGGRKMLWHRADAASSGVDAPFPATANITGTEAADARESSVSVTPLSNYGNQSEDPQMTADKALFQSVIDNTVPDILAPELADTMEAAYLRHAGNTDMEALFEAAVDAYMKAGLAASANL